MPKVGAIKQLGTASKSSSVSPQETQKAKAPIVKVPSISSGMEKPQLPAIELSAPKKPQPPPPVEFRGNAGIREQSETRGRKPTSGSGRRTPFAATSVLGKGTPSIPPPTAVGTAGVPIAQLKENVVQGIDLGQGIKGERIVPLHLSHQAKQWQMFQS